MDEELARPMSFDAVTRLGQHFHEALLAHYARSPKDQAAVMEALNALAAIAATILRGTDFSPNAMHFFMLALEGCAKATPPGAPDNETLQ